MSANNEKKEPSPASSEVAIDEKVANELGLTGKELSDVLPVVEHLSLDEAREIIRETIDGKDLDPNFDTDLLKRARAALEESALSHETARKLVEELKLEAALFDDSPYLEVNPSAPQSSKTLTSGPLAHSQVRAVIENTDDPSMPVNTFRAWFLGFIYVTVGTGINVFFSARYPGISVTTFCAQVIAYPMGKFMEWCLPTKKVKIFGYECSLNPGPFNMKGVGVYSTDIIFVQRLPKYFNQTQLGANPGYQILMTLSTQMIGFAVAGLSRRFLVYPPSMIWPQTLATVALNRSFHQEENAPANGWKITRLRFFLWVFIGYSLYFVFPDAIFQALSYFNPTNVKLALITGSVTGLGINPWTQTFDYNNLFIDPLITPLHASLNVYAGLLPTLRVLKFTAGRLHWQGRNAFFGNPVHCHVSKVLNSDYKLDEVAFAAYGAPYQTAAYAAMFFCFFACYTATVVHVGLYHRREVWDGVKSAIRRKSARDAYGDVHNRLMRAYKEVPEWWFFLVLVISVFGIVSTEVYNLGLPVWGIFFGVLLALIFIVPVGIVMAVSNFEITINVLAGTLFKYGSSQYLSLILCSPTVMLFKTYGVVPTAQAIGYVQDMKLGHYVKVRSSSLLDYIPS
ncbi:hypothetical protein P7C70_g2848, partial [Phenoliferia sp. Uapishka_3]